MDSGIKTSETYKMIDPRRKLLIFRLPKYTSFTEDKTPLPGIAYL